MKLDAAAGYMQLCCEFTHLTGKLLTVGCMLFGKSLIEQAKCKTTITCGSLAACMVTIADVHRHVCLHADAKRKKMQN
jgi:hypothetical protein